MISDGHLTNSTDANYVKRKLNQITSTFCRSDSHHFVPRLDSATLSHTDSVTDVTDNSRSTDPPEPLSDLQPIPSEEHDEDIVESCNQPHSFSDTVKTTPPEDFQVVQRKKNRGPPRKRIAVGRSIDSTVTFKGVAKKAVFCINRLEPETTTETVSLFSRNNGILVISCYLVKPPDASASSENTDPPRFIHMRVCLPHSDTEKILSDELWPQGVAVRPWSFKSRQAYVIFDFPVSYGELSLLLMVGLWLVYRLCLLTAMVLMRLQSSIYEFSDQRRLYLVARNLAF